MGEMQQPKTIKDDVFHKYILKSTAGIVTGVAGAGAGAIVGTIFSGGSFDSRITSAAIGGVLGYIFGEPLGVSIVGKYNGENGKYSHALCGNLLGSLVGLGVFNVVKSSTDAHDYNAMNVSYGVFLTFSVGGSIVGYQTK